jgi:GxxExxY protein
LSVNQEDTERVAHKSADALTREVIAAAIEVHRILGPGLLESIYEEAFCHELALRNISFTRQQAVDVVYKGVAIKGQRLDLLVHNELIVEIKAVRHYDELFTAQVLSYLKATRLKRALLLNFGCQRLVDGIKRISL